MIICISANPALDRRVWLSSLHPGTIHRARAAAVASGGKAAHVAMVARRLGETVLWIAMTGGATGDECRCGLASMGIRTVTVKTQGVTRTNLELIEEESGLHTEIREPGDPVSATEVAEFVQCCREELRNAPGSCVVLSGSLPPGVSSDLYRRLIVEIHMFGSTALLDSSGEALSAALVAEPDVIKPNQVEASEAVNQAIEDVPSARTAAKGLRALGARAVALSLAEQGMVWADGAGVLCAHGPPIEGTSNVGCGDSMLAGIAVGLDRRLAREEVVRLAVACGAANCYAKMPAMIEKKEVENLIGSVVVEHAIRGGAKEQDSQKSGIDR